MFISESIIVKRAIRDLQKMGMTHVDKVPQNPIYERKKIKWFPKVELFCGQFYVGEVNIPHIDPYLKRSDLELNPDGAYHGRNLATYGICIDGTIRLWAN